ncbi:P-loop containing nucleoside triphosphate hydrolase protein [Schizophyllum commune]
MTSLRTFQTEIEDIHSREMAKQRLQGARQLKEKENKHPQPKKETHGATDGEPATRTAAPQDENDTETSMREVEEQIMAQLLAGTQKEHDAARDTLASLITQHHGEYVFRIGASAPHTKLFAGKLMDADEGWEGKERTVEEVDSLVEGVRTAVEEIGGKVCVLFEVKTDHPRATLLLRLPPPSVSLTPEVRCAVVGNVDSGKSTTLGVLTRGVLDDGRGSARVGLFRHKHEIETGRTSSVGMEILGFGPDGQPILPQSTDPKAVHREKLGWDEISKRSAKIVSFIDLAGHERYLKTTLYGLTSGAPSCVVLMVGGNAGLIGMSKEHLAIALALNVPVVVCITKIDMTPANVLQETIKQVSKILISPGCRKTPVFVESIETAVELASTYARNRLCPIFRLSNVDGRGLDYVRTFLNLLPSSEADVDKFAVDQPLEFSITEVWSVPYVGTVVNGIINSGRIQVGDQIMFGPDSNGNFANTVVKSMQRKRADVTTAEAGQCVAVALKRVRRTDVRKGMIIVHRTEAGPPKAVMRFEGQVLILYHNTTLQPGYQAMLHTGAVRQTVKILSMDHPQNVLRTGDRATVQFEFISRPEFVKVGMKLLFREGKTKGLGVITKLL